jgi:hypothetical protein
MRACARSIRVMPPRSFAWIPLFRRITVVVSALAFTAACGSAEPEVDPTRDHAIFVGATLTFGHAFSSGRITNVVNNEAEIVVDGRRERVSLRQQGDLKVRRAPTMSTTSVNIENQKGVRMFSPFEQSGAQGRAEPDPDGQHPG